MRHKRITISSSQGMRETKIQITRQIGQKLSLHVGISAIDFHVWTRVSFWQPDSESKKLPKANHSNLCWFWWVNVCFGSAQNFRSSKEKRRFSSLKFCPPPEKSHILAGNILPFNFGRIFPANMSTFYERMRSIVLSLMQKENPIPKINEGT